MPPQFSLQLELLDLEKDRPFPLITVSNPPPKSSVFLASTSYQDFLRMETASSFKESLTATRKEWSGSRAPVIIILQ